MNAEMDNSSAAMNSSNLGIGVNVSLNASDACLQGANNRDGGNYSSFSRTLLYVSEICFNCFDFVNVIGNVMLILLIYKASKLKNGPARILMNQAVADIGVGVLWLVFYITLYTTSDVNIIETVMLVQRIGMLIFTAESVQSLAMTLFNIHLAICSPLRYRIQSTTRYFLMFLVLSWSLNIATWFFIFLTDDFFVFQRDSIIVVYNVTTSNVCFCMLLFVVGYVAPSVALVVSYTRIWRHMRATSNPEVQAQSITKDLIRQAQGILLVSLVYLVTFLPLFMFEIINSYTDLVSTMSDDGVFILGTILVFVNYIYVFGKLPLFLLAFKSFRRVFKDMFCSRCCQKQATQSSRFQVPRIDVCACNHVNTAKYSDQERAAPTSDSGFVSTPVTDGHLGSEIVDMPRPLVDTLKDIKDNHKADNGMNKI